KDIDALIYNELPAFDFNAFEKKHGWSVVFMLEPDTRAAVAAKFLEQDVACLDSFKKLKESYWVKNLNISDFQLAQSYFRDLFFKEAQICVPGYTYENFESDYTADCIAA